MQFKINTPILLILVVTFLLKNSGFSQTHPVYLDTLYYMNASAVGCIVIDTNLFGAKVIIPAKNNRSKEKIVDGERLFSIKFANGREKIIYKPDTSEKEPFSVEEARLFIAGEKDALKGYKSTWSRVGAIAIGFAGGTLNAFLAPGPPFVYAGCMLIPKIRIKRKTVSNQEYLKYDAYLLGYERVARKQKAMNAFVYGLAGATAGVLVKTFVIKK